MAYKCILRKCPLSLVLFILVILTTILTFWHGMNSDLDNVPPLLTQLLPAGHCTCKFSTNFNCANTTYASLNTAQPKSPQLNWTFQYGRDDRNLGLSKEQCQASFPGLFEDINRAVTFWSDNNNLSSDMLDNLKIRKGMARASLSQGELYVVETRAAQDDHRRKILAVLSSIYRALPTNRSTVPDINFVFSVEDRVDDVAGPGQPIWVFGRKSTEESVWLMPDFGFWAWGNPSNNIGPYDKVVERIEMQDSATGSRWESKIPKLVWRGKLSFAPKLRRGLLQAARNKPWGDVKELVWRRKSNFISMEDHCNYMFIAHVEGRAFSSSLKYRQACRSVIVAHKMQFMQHHHYLMQSDGPHQNYVEVERDFSDLSEKMEMLLANPAEARRIADNSVTTFRERYLTKAAEACFWRESWDGWAKVAPPLDRNHNSARMGMRYESFLLLETKAMMSFP